MDEHKDVCFAWKRKLLANIWHERAKPRANVRSFKYISHFIKKKKFFLLTILYRNYLDTTLRINMTLIILKVYKKLLFPHGNVSFSKNDAINTITEFIISSDIF